MVYSLAESRRKNRNVPAARNQVPPSPIYCTWGTLPKLDVPKKGKYLYPVSSLRWIIVRIIWATWLVCYLSWVAVFARVASGKLRRHPYSEYKFANLLMLWQVGPSPHYRASVQRRLKVVHSLHARDLDFQIL